MEIIGLGSAGYEICKLFSERGRPAFSIDTRPDASFVFPKVETVEEAESKTPQLHSIRDSLKGDELLFVMAGGGVISGASLAILEQFKDKKINVLYIQPDASFLNNVSKKRERMARNILQEFVRSGMLERIYLVSNKDLASLIPDISIGTYFTKINEKIVDMWDLYQYYKKVDPIMGNIEEPSDIDRIISFGFYNLNSEKEGVFFNLKNVRQKHFYFALSSTTLQDTGKVLQLVIEKLEKAKDTESVEISHAFFDSGYEVDNVYILYYTNHVQS
tara:strand:- start:342 stop:1163 length:822 start_codon:yes stop_codon:yes gene_type:complete